MKTKLLVAVVISVIVTSCTTKPKFLFLNASQLKPLGIELNEKGVFYKNENPDWKQDHQKYSCLAFSCTNNNYLSSSHFDVTDTLKVTSGVDSIIINMSLTKNNFYPLLIGNTSGIKSMDENLPAELKLLPVAICMAETKLPARQDTVVIWLKPTESLRKSLPEGINMDDYLTINR